MLYRLIILSGPSAGQQVTVLKPSMTVGSGADSGLHIADEEMASSHAVLEHDDTGLLIRDLGTMHKIIVNHHQVDQCRLKHGDEIEIGRTRFLLQATVRAEVDGSKPPEAPNIPERRRSPVVWIYLIAGLAVTYLVARPFLTLPEPADPVDPNTTEIETGTLHVVTASSNNWTNALIVQVRTNVPSKTNLTTAATNPPAVTNQEPRTNVGAPVIAASNVAPPVATSQAVVVTIPVAPVHTNAASGSNRPNPRPPAAVLPAVPILKITSAEQRKFPATESYLEMRTLTVTLQHAATVDIEPSSVTMEVNFFDRNLETGQITPSSMIVSRNPIRIPGPWIHGRQNTATATYTVPNGTRMPRPQFYGFSVRLFYAGVLQDQTFRPATLRDSLPK